MKWFLHNQNKNSNKHPSKEKWRDRIGSSFFTFLDHLFEYVLWNKFNFYTQITEEEKQILNNWSTEKFHINLKFETDRSTSSGLMLSDEAISSECLETLKHLIVAQSWQSYRSEVSPLKISEHLVQLARARLLCEKVCESILLCKHNAIPEISIFTST